MKFSLKSAKNGEVKEFSNMKELFVTAEGKEVARDVRFDFFGEYLGTAKLTESKNWEDELGKRVSRAIEKQDIQLQNLKALNEIIKASASERAAQEMQDQLASMTDEQLARMAEALRTVQENRQSVA